MMMRVAVIALAQLALAQIAKAQSSTCAEVVKREDVEELIASAWSGPAGIEYAANHIGDALDLLYAKLVGEKPKSRGSLRSSRQSMQPSPRVKNS